ncbi:hypothetical protein IED13_27190 [Bosea sp. SSUT16]|uniref:Uncharacterized protein n=1 Tax=Bosea spartocytisi TaxID=2773451 RepID=A0A927I2V8_9HYPH|nr:hypothetical protein [Bosea spartocytisi]MBD3849401.1 hypothetical protein [Bosea spartocytisi]MCT4475008.1 hypothetical protein [Bosea spartocytisi]
MSNAVFAHPAIASLPDHDAALSVHGGVPAQTAPLILMWRTRAAGAIGDHEQAELRALLAKLVPLRVEHWREALAGDPAAAVAMALKLSGLDVLDTPRHDLVMSVLMLHALDGSEGARTTLAFALQRRRYLGEDVAPLIASWRRRDPAAIHRASLQALMEALS